jgi:hypothetical protein
MRLFRSKPAASPAPPDLSTAATGDLIAALVERAGEAERLKGMIGIALEEIREMKDLIDRNARMVQEFPRIARESIGLMDKNRELEHRAEQSEAMLERAVGLMIERDLDDFQHGDDD